MGMFHFLFEIGTIWLLLLLIRKYNLPESNVLLYALNPLVIIETVGNLHHEGIMGFFVLATVLLLTRKRDFLAGLCLALAVSTKFLPLMFLPAILVLLGWKRFLLVLGGLVLGTTILFIPIFSMQFFENISQSLNLYFQTFEFNASIYYLGREIGYLFSGYNIIQTLAPILSMCAFIIIVWLSIKTKRDNYAQFLKISATIFVVFLFFSTTIHPWYLILPILLFSLSHSRFIYLWSLLIMGTYMNYAFIPYEEQLWWVLIEYAVVFSLLAQELRYKRLNFNFLAR